MAVAPIDLAAIALGTGGFVIHGQDAHDGSGWSVASAGDVNGDGFDDLIIGARYGDAAGNAKTDAGDSYVVFGTSGGFGAAIDLASVTTGTGGFVIHGQDASDLSGWSVASAGDVNGDGFDDLIIGARWGDAAGNAKDRAGDSYVMFGKSGGFGAAISLATIATGTGGFVIHGQDPIDQSGISVASAGDVNGDGFDDLIIGAPSGSAAGNAKSGAGDSYVVFGKSGGFNAAIDLSSVAAGSGGFVIHGQDAFGYSGRSVASAGDVNGDGFDDLIIGAYFGDAAGNAKTNAGDSYVIFGKSGGFGAAIDLSSVAAGSGGFVIHGQDANDWSGRSVASAGDVNGDGFDDLIIGARQGDAAGNAKTNAGDSYVVFGQAGGFGAAIDLVTVAAGTGGFVIHGQDGGDQSGWSVASAGDVNGDGFDDLIIGAPSGDAAGNAKSVAGDSYVVFGKSGGFGAAIDLATIAAGTGGFVIHGQDASDQSGLSVASAGDVNGDGFDDLIIGARYGDAAGNAKTDAGDSYVIFGQDFLSTVTHAGTSAGETLTGTSAADIMVGGLGDDILLGGGGADVLIGGAGDDTLRISDLGFARVIGGSGTDTLALAGSGQTLNLAAIANTKLQDIERIDLTGIGNNVLQVSTLEVLNLSSSSNSLRVLGNAGDTLSFGTEVWTPLGTAGGFSVWTNGQARVEVASAVKVKVGIQPINLAAVAAGTGGFVIYGQDAGDRSGWSVASAGDVNGDGFDDLIIGASFGDAAGNAKTDAGDSYVVFGQAGTSGAAIDLATVATGTGGFVIHGQDPFDRSGFSVASAGDVNGDGFDDLIIGAIGGAAADNTKFFAGDSYVVFGKSGGFGAAIDLASVAAGTGGFVIHGQDAFDRSGWSVASAGDVNGDGFDDLIIGARDGAAAGNAKDSAGESYVVFGKPGEFGAAIDLTSVATGTGGFVIHGQDGGDQSGISVASAGDVNGDGLDDLIIGARYGDAAGDAKTDAGDTYVVFGKPGGFGAAIDLASVATGTGGFVIHGADEFDYSGWSVASAGDVNGDGFQDLIIGARYGDAAGNAKTNAGDSYVVFGQAGGFGAVINLASVADGTSGFVIHGQDAGGRSGWSVASAGDMNGDGFDDLIIGAPFENSPDNATTTAGESYVIFGKSGGFGAAIDLATAAGADSFVIRGLDAYDLSGLTVASAGDVNGDGFDDLIIGARYGDAAGNAKTDAGDSYVIFGQDFLSTVTHAGTSAGETLTGTSAADIMVGGLGDDILLGNGGADVLIGGAGNDTIHISDPGFLRVMGGSGTDTLALAGSGLTLDLAAIANTKLQDIERIDLTGTGDNTLRLTKLEVLNLSSTSNTLRVLGNTGDSVDFDDAGWVEGANAAGFTTWSNNEAKLEIADAVSVACFATGTRICTTRGEVPVEALTDTDHVLTRGDTTRRVRWIGHRTLAPSRHPRPHDVQPIRIAPDAFGPGLPVRPLRLSPDHAVFAGGALIPVRYLLNGATIVQDDVDSVTYFHVELADETGAASHDVLLAEALPCESYLDTGNRDAFANGGVTMVLHPDFARQVWEMQGCAPLVREGRTLAAVRAALLSRATAMGHATTSDPGLCLMVDGDEHPALWDGDVAHFEVPLRARAVRLVSRRTVPAQLRVSCDDHRTLGVAVTAVEIDGCTVPLDDPMLSDGWHAPEPDLRWTDGNAEVPCGSGATVTVTIASLEHYWIEPDEMRHRTVA